MIEGGRPVRFSVRGLKKSYGQRPALRGVSFDLIDGVTALVGPNGSGKSTLRRAVVGIGGWDAGSISVDGIDPSRHPKAARAKIGYMPERIALRPKCGCKRIFGSPPRRRACGGRRRRPRWGSSSPQWGSTVAGGSVWSATCRRGTRSASGWPRRWWGVLLSWPSLLALDEPMSGLDPVDLAEVNDSIRAYADRGRAVLISTHQLNQARALADRVVVVSEGTILYEGSIGGMNVGGEGAATVRVGLATNGHTRPVEEVFVP